MSAHNIQLFSGAVDIPDDLRVTSLTVGDGLMELGANGAFANVGYVMNNPGGSNAAVYYDKISDQLRVVHTDFGGKEDPNTVTIKNEDITLNVAGNTHSRFYYGDGGLLSNLVSDLQSVTAVEANSDQMIILSNATALWANVGNVLVEGNVTAGEFHGDAGWLSNVQIPLEEVIMNGNTTSNIVEFHNALSLVTTGNVGIQNVAPLGDLSIGANVVFDDDATDILKIQGNVNVHRITIGEWVLGGGGAQGLQQITDTGNTTTITSEFNNTSTAFVTAAKAGIGTSTPSSDAMLHVDGHVRLGGPADTPNNEEMKVRVAGALNIIANHSNTDNTTSNLVMKAGEINAASITLAGAVTDEDRQKIVFKTREVEALTIDRFGNANFVSNVVVASGAKFIGDGSGLTGLVSDLQSVSVGGATTNQTIKFTNATEGANITSNLYVGSNLHLDDVTLAAASVTLQGVTTNGATTTDAITITDTTEATTTSTGALKVSGGIAAAKDIRAANVVVSRVGVGLTAGANPDPAHLVEVDGNVKATNVICESLTLDSVALQTLYSLDQVVNVNNTTSNIVIISNTTPSTSMSTGCLQLSGGLGVNGNVYAQEFVNTNAGGWRLTHTHSTRPTVNGASVGGELTGGNGDVETGFLRLSGGGSTAGTGAPKSYIDICGASASTDFANNITFGIKGSEKVRLTDAGLGVGTATPLTPLHISSTNEITSSPAGSAVSQMRYGSTNSTVLFGVSSTAGHISAYDTSNFSTQRNLCLNADGGFVGIGTSSPDTELDVAGTITLSNGTQANAIRTDSDGNLQFLRNDASNDLPTITINDETGNVGIGTDNPGYTLDVAGGVGIAGDLNIGGETILGTATYRKRRDWDRSALAYVYLGNVRTNDTTGIRLDVSLNNANTGYTMYQFQITLNSNDPDHSGGQLVYSSQGTNNNSILRSIEIGYAYVGASGIYEYQLWLKDPGTSTVGNMDAYLNCQGYYNFDTGVSDVAHGGSAPTNFNSGIVGVLVDRVGNVGIGTTNPAYTLDVAGTAYLSNIASTDYSKQFSQTYDLDFGGITATDEELSLFQFEPTITNHAIIQGEVDVDILSKRAQTYMHFQSQKVKIKFSFSWDARPATGSWVVRDIFVYRTKSSPIGSQVLNYPVEVRYKYKGDRSTDPDIPPKVQVYLRYNGFNFVAKINVKGTYHSNYTDYGLSFPSSIFTTDGDTTDASVDTMTTYDIGTGNVGLGANNPTRKLQLGAGYQQLGGYLDTYRVSGVVGGMVLGVKQGGGTDVDALYISDSGLVGIGVTDPAQKLDVNGNARIRSKMTWANQSSWSTNKGLQGPNNVLYGALGHHWSTYSSRKLKENIETIPDALSKVKRLRGVNYTWKQGQGDNVGPNAGDDYDQTGMFKQQTQIGFIADEVAEVLPTVCGFDEDGFASSVEYASVTPVLVNAIKELDNKIGKSEASSDDRLKDNEACIENAIKTLMKLKPQVYDKKENLDSNVYQHEAGLIAQDIWYDAPELRFAVKPGLLSEIPPEAPIRSDDPREDPDYSKWGPNPASVDYNYLLPYIIKSIQEIVTELPRQKARVEGITPANLNDYRGLLVSADTNELRNGIPRLSITQKSYDKKCFGVVSFSNTHTTDNEILIDTKSCGGIWVINYSNIESGDYLTSSNIAGYAMKQNDDLLHNYTVAKSSIDCDFTPVQKTIKRVKQKLTNVTYYVKTDLFEISKEQYDALDDMYRTCNEYSFYTLSEYCKVSGKGGYDKMEYYKENNPTISIDDWNSLESNTQNTYSPYYSNLITTQVSLEDYSTLEESKRSNCAFTTKILYYYKIRTESKDLLPGYEPEVRQEYVNILDEHGQLQWEDHPIDTEKVYKIRYLDASGQQTDEANAVHIAAFVGCTYHCG